MKTESRQILLRNGKYLFVCCWYFLPLVWSLIEIKKKSKQIQTS
jgi:hypothetical protein